MKIKQLFIGAAVVGLMGMVPSLARAAVSSPVIGMQDIEITTTWTLLGVSFFDMKDTSVETISVHDFLSGDFVNGDQIQVQDADGSSHTTVVWDETVSAWCTTHRGVSTGTKCDLTLSAGTGVWLKKVDASTASPKTVTTFGRVILAPEITVEFPRQYKCVSLPIFEEVAINSDKFTWSGIVEGDFVQIPDAEGHTTAVWNGTLGKWCTSKRGYPTTTPSDLTIKPFVGAWLVSTSATAQCTYNAAKAE